MIFSDPPNAEVMSGGQPEPSGLAVTDSSGRLESLMSKTQPLYERLRGIAAPANLDAFDVPVQARHSFYVAMGEWLHDGLHGLFLPPNSGDGHCDPEALAETVARRFSSLADLYNGKNTEIPIEDMLAGALLWLEMDYCGFPVVDYLGGPNDEIHVADRRSFGMDGRTARLECLIASQPNIAGYRADFAVWFTAGAHIGGIAIECDGHAFHEKTKEQAARDKKRDREMLCAGYPVARFSGSEVFKDTSWCVRQIHELAFPVMERVARDAGLLK